MSSLSLHLDPFVDMFSLTENTFRSIRNLFTRICQSSFLSQWFTTYNTQVMTHSKTESDAELAALSLAGNSEAFVAMVDRYGPSLYGYARRLTGNTDDAEDIAQETFVRLHEHLGKLDFSEPLKPWLFRVCTNLCRNHAKRRKSLPFSQLIHDEEGFSFLDTLETEDMPLPEKTHFSSERKEVRAAVHTLPRKYQIVIVLYYWEGLSYEEIASTLSLPVNTVRTHLKRAKSLLTTPLHHLLSS